MSISTSSATLSVPKRAVYGLMPQSLCLTVARPVRRPSSLSSKEIGRRVPASSSSPWTVACAAGVQLEGARAELDRGAFQHLVVDRLLDARLLFVAERRDPAAASRTRSDPPSV